MLIGSYTVDSGEIAETGRHSELVEEGGQYAVICYPVKRDLIYEYTNDYEPQVRARYSN